MDALFVISVNVVEWAMSDRSVSHVPTSVTNHQEHNLLLSHAHELLSLMSNLLKAQFLLSLTIQVHFVRHPYLPRKTLPSQDSPLLPHSFLTFQRFTAPLSSIYG